MSEQQPIVINHKVESLFTHVRTTNAICCIYMITSPSGKKYVGQTVNIFWRIYKYSKMHCFGQAKLFNSFKKYGWGSHKFEILKECNIDELNALEVYFINFYNTFNTKEGLNLNSGGDRPLFSDETKEKIRLANTGKRYSKEINYKKGSPTRGKKLSAEMINRMRIWLRNRSAESRKRMSERFMGDKNPMFGRKWTDEQKKAHGDKIRGKQTGKKHSEESRLKMRIAHSNRSDETKLKMSNAKKGKKLSEEHKAKIKEGGIRRYKKLNETI